MIRTLGDSVEDAEEAEEDGLPFRGGLASFGGAASGRRKPSSSSYNNDNQQSSSRHHNSYNDEDYTDETPKRPTKMFWHGNHIDKVQELVPEEVRWFFKEDAKLKWVPFIGYDSLRVECRYRALEYSRSRSNSLTEEDVDTCINVRGGLYEVDIVNGIMHPIYWKGESLPILRGTWFVDSTWQPLEYEYSLQLEQDHLARFIGQKIPELNNSEEKKPSRPSVRHNVAFREFHVDWYDINEVYMYSEAKSSRAYRSVTKTFGMTKSGTGTRLYRGYNQQAHMEDKPADVTHLVFVIHGIGQKANQNRIIHCCNELRNGANRLIPQYFPDLESSSQRVEFLPVEWRTDLHLDGELVDSITPDKLRQLRVLLNSTAMDILYYTSPLYRGEIINGLESELNRLYTTFCERHPYFEANNGKVSICGHSLGCVIAYDILTGWDPIELYDQYVCNVVKEASRTSFGNSRETVESLNSTDRSRRLHDFYVKSIAHKQQSTLKFKVVNFFTLGSPLGVFLTLRGIRPQPSGLLDHILPKPLCERFFNIYYPTDPVAYRLEPLVLKHYSTIHPLKIHRLYEVNKTPYAEMKSKAYAAFGKKKVGIGRSRSRKKGGERSRESSASLASPSSHTGSSGGSSTVSPDRNRLEADKSPASARKNGGFTGAMKGFFSRYVTRQSEEERMAAELEDYESEEGETDEDMDQMDSIEQTELEHRLDYALPSSGTIMSNLNSYVSAIFSHTSYWSSPEVALFLMSHIFSEYGPVK